MHHNILVILLFLPLSQSIGDVAWWSSVAQLNVGSMLAGSSSRPSCPLLSGLSPGQAKICELFQEHMPAVGMGAYNAIQECQHQFRNRRWNCSTPTTSPHIGPLHKKGVAHEVGRRCRQGSLPSCGCSDEPKPKELKDEWAWTGCGDNVGHGYRFARNFIDIREKEEDARRSSEDGRSLMNRRNNEAGRRLLKKLAAPKCKCHGVSGACNLKTCWMQLPTMRRMGEQLVKKYNNAHRVIINSRGNLQFVGEEEKGRGTRKTRALQTDLVFLDDSPDYCRYDRSLGTVGTRGRECNKYSDGPDGCETLCCGRGYDEEIRESEAKCRCKFEWCCRVVCEKCLNTTHVYTCK